MRSANLHLPPGLPLYNDGSRVSKAVQPSQQRSDTGIGAAIDFRESGWDGRETHSIVVEHVWPGSPAEAHGLLAGDVICSVDGAIIQSIEVAKQSIRGPEGSTVTLGVHRDGQSLDIGPIERGSWVTIAQLDSNIARLRRLASDLRPPQAAAFSEICSSLTRLRMVLDEERTRFQGSMLLSRTRENQAEMLAKKLSRTLIEVSEESARRQERATALEQRLQQALDALESASGTAKAGEVSTYDHNYPGNSEDGEGSVEEGINPRVGALLAALESRSAPCAAPAARGKSPKIGMKLALLQRRKDQPQPHGGSEGIGWVCKELRTALEQEAERYRTMDASRAAEKERLRAEVALARAELSRAPSPALSAAPSPLAAAAATPDSTRRATPARVPQGWKLCMASGEVFYYSAGTGEVRFSAPPDQQANLEHRDINAQTIPGIAQLAAAAAMAMGSPRSVSLDVSVHDSDSTSSPIIKSASRRPRSNDAIVWGTMRVPGRRATFGKTANIEGEVLRATPYLADTDLTGASSMQGCIAVIRRGVCTFTEKADRAIKAGAIGIIFVNHEDRLFDVIGHSPHVQVPVIAVALGGAESIPDGATIRFAFDQGAELPPMSSIECGMSPVSTCVQPSRPVPQEHVSTLSIDVGVHGAEAAGKPSWATQSTASSPRMDSASLCSQAFTEERDRDMVRLASATLPEQHGHAAQSAHVRQHAHAHVSAESSSRAATHVGGEGEGSSKIKRKASLDSGGGARKAAWKRGQKEEAEDVEDKRQQATNKWGEHGDSQKWILVRRAIDSVGDIWLPESWKMRMSRSYGKVFYYNTVTGVRRWTRPASGDGVPPHDSGAPTHDNVERALDKSQSAFTCTPVLGFIGSPPPSQSRDLDQGVAASQWAGSINSSTSWEGVHSDGALVAQSQPNSGGLASQSKHVMITGSASSSASQSKVCSPVLVPQTSGRWSILASPSPRAHASSSSSSSGTTPSHHRAASSTVSHHISSALSDRVKDFETGKIRHEVMRHEARSEGTAVTKIGGGIASRADGGVDTKDDDTPALTASALTAVWGSPPIVARTSPPISSQCSPNSARGSPLRSPQFLSTRELESLPPWPDELVDALGSMGRIVVGQRQIICTRAEFGIQADPAKGSAAVRGQLVRAEPWLADSDILRTEQVKGKVVLIGRGGCPFTDKARRAQRAGAVAVVIVNNADVLFNVLGQAKDVRVPVVSVTKSDGDTLTEGAIASIIWGMHPKSVSTGYAQTEGVGVLSTGYTLRAELVPGTG